MIVLFLIGLTIAQVWAHRHTERIVDGTDAPQYMYLAANVASGHGFSMSSVEPYPLTLYREPGYPLFVAVVYRLAGFSNDWVARVQAALVGLIAVLTYLLARQVGSRGTAFVAGLLVALSPDLADLARQVLSETLFTALFLGAALTLILAYQKGRAPWFALAGALFGLAALTRGQALLLAALLAAAWLLVSFRQWRRLAPKVLLMGACLFLVVTPWLVRNYVLFETPALTSRYGVNLIRRAPKVDYSAETVARWGGAAAWMATYPLSALVVPFNSFQYGRQYYEHEIWDFHVNESVRLLRRYEPICRMAHWDACATEISWGFIRERPGMYVAQAILELVKLNFKPLPGEVSAIRNVFVWLTIVSAILLWRSRRLRGPLGWVLVVIALYNLILLPLDTQERYTVPCLPLYAVVAGSGLGWLAQRLRDARPLGAGAPRVDASHYLG